MGRKPQSETVHRRDWCERCTRKQVKWDWRTFSYVCGACGYRVQRERGVTRDACGKFIAKKKSV